MPPLIELTLAAPLEEAWPHLREPALIRRWFGWEYDGLAQEIDVIFLQEAAVDEPSHTLSWGDGVQEGDRIELRADGDRTVLGLIHSPQDGFDPIAEGWISFVQQLRFALERHPGEERRTLRLSGPAGEPPAGEEYFRTEHQAGLVVDGALAVIAADPSRGTATLTINAFGAPPDEAAWRAWWQARAGAGPR